MAVECTAAYVNCLPMWCCWPPWSPTFRSHTRILLWQAVVANHMLYLVKNEMTRRVMQVDQVLLCGSSVK
eukprot:391532-Amphidinium_carterae.1